MSLLLTVAVPAPAWPATGTVTITIRHANSPGQGTQARLTNPQDGHCYTLRELAPSIQGDIWGVDNGTDKKLSLYPNDTCTKESVSLVVNPKGSYSGIAFHSFKLD